MITSLLQFLAFSNFNGVILTCQSDCSMFNYLLRNVLVVIGAQARRFLVPQLERCFEQLLSVTSLEVFQNLGYSSPTQDQAQTAQTLMLGS